MSAYHLSLKFYLGILLIVLSLVLGKITQIAFLFYFQDEYIRWLSVIIYILSWIPLVVGLVWVGQEYAEVIKKYFSYKYYHQAIKRKVKQGIAKRKMLRD